jgi:hypothetical protein
MINTSIATTGFLRIGNDIYGSTGNSSAKDRISHGLIVKNDNLKMLEATTNKEDSKKQKIVENFETAIIERLKNDKDNNKTNEEINNLVGSITNVIDKIKLDFGQEFAIKTMAKILKDTENRINAMTIATSIGSVLKEKQSILSKILSGKATEADVQDAVKKQTLKLSDDLNNPDVYFKQEVEKLEKMVDFLNQKDEEFDILDNDKLSSLSAALNNYYGEVIVKDEDYYLFSSRFDWLNNEECNIKNKEYSNLEYGFDFIVTVSELGRENLDELISFLQNDLNDVEAANFIENLSDSDDIFAAINYLFETHYVEPEIKPLSNSNNKVSQESNVFFDKTDIEKLLQEKFALSDEEIAKAAEPWPEEHSQFDYDSKFISLHITANEPFSTEKEFFNNNLNAFLNSRLLDKVNTVIQENSIIKAKFLEIASKNFFSNEKLVPDNYGLTQFPSNTYTGTGSLSSIMGVMDKNAPERALSNLKTLADGTGGWTLPGEEFKILNDPEQLLERKNYFNKIYIEALERYQNEKGLSLKYLEEKGLLLDEIL